MTIAPSSATRSAATRTNGSAKHQPAAHTNTLLNSFLTIQSQLASHKEGAPVNVDGHTLSIADVVAAARYNAPVALDSTDGVRARVDASQHAIDTKLAEGQSVYGLSTGYGGSADTRTNNHLVLGKSLLQHQHIGVLPSQSTTPLGVLPLSDPMASLSMPESWVRAAILIRMNSLIRGHSGVRWEFIEALGVLLKENIVPFVPLRGSISASGDLSPLSYVAGTLIGNPAIRVFDGPASFGPRKVVSAPEAFAAHGLKHVTFAPKEHLGLLNGTAFSAGVATLALNDAVHVAMLAQICTAMGTEALLGTQGSHDRFIHDVARPHRGQVEAARNIGALLEESQFAHLGKEKELKIEDDSGKLRQDRYPLRTAPQFLGPQLEDILHALDAVQQECNTTTDNPLIDGQTGEVHHGGNFQAMAVTNPMEHTRLALHHIGKLLFAQMTELLNPAFNRGLPPNLAGSDPSVNYFAKGLDIATAAYVSELGFLANPVSTHIQSAEMHNQAVNSLALISARQTITALDVLSMLISSYIVALCQALDLRTLQLEFHIGLNAILKEEISQHFGWTLHTGLHEQLQSKLFDTLTDALATATTQDATGAMNAATDALSSPLVNTLLMGISTSGKGANATQQLGSIPKFNASVASRGAALWQSLRTEYLKGKKGPTPASKYLGKGSRAIYEFVRSADGLGIPMHGVENLEGWANGWSGRSIGGDVSLVYEAITQGRMQGIVVGLFQDLDL